MTIHPAKNGVNTMFIIPPSIRCQRKCRLRRNRSRRSIKLSSRSFLDRIHDQKQISIQRTRHALPRLTIAVRRLVLTDSADLLPNGSHIITNIVAVRRLDGAGNLWKQTEQRASPGFLQAARAVQLAIRTDSANLVPDDDLQFL